MRAVPMAMKAGGTLWSTRAAPTRRSFFVEYESRADLKVFFVDYESRAGWRNKSKQHLLY